MFNLLIFFLFPLFGSIQNLSFPDPLTPEEEEKYLKLWQKKDYHAREILI